MRAVSLAALSVFIWLNSACDDDDTYRTDGIKDLFLNADESTHITLQMGNEMLLGQDYCRNFKLQQEDLSYATVSCTENQRNFAPFVEEDDFMMTVENTERYEALNVSERSDFLEDIVDSVVEVRFPAASGNITLTGVFIHPLYYSYFMSLSMSTLFIFTADQNEPDYSSINETEDLRTAGVNVVNLVTLSWNPDMNPVVGGWPVFMDDVLVSVQTDVVNENFLGLASDVQLLLDGGKMLNYDHDDMYMVRVNSVIGECDQAEWLRYAYIEDFYQAKTDNASVVFEFEYAGQGYTKGVDTRIKRAYGFDGTSVWYYEADGAALDEFSFKSHAFDEKQLVSYYGLMWLLIALVVVLFCCVCACCCYCSRQRSKSQKKQRSNSEELQLTTQV